MNQGSIFIPSGQRSRTTSRVDAEAATKAAVAVQDPSGLSEEELALAAKLASDGSEGLSQLFVNGVLVRRGLTWIGDGEELWGRQ
jgi:hypothetical protein